MRDEELYDVLGVTREATDSEIRRAYRKQAMRWHPDKNPNNREEAELRFKLVAQAYEILRDPQKRQVYDECGLEAAREGRQGTGRRGYSGNGFHVDPFELFNQIFQGGDPFADPFFSDARGDFFGSRGGAGGGRGFFGGSALEQMMGGMMGGAGSSFMSTSSMGGHGFGHGSGGVSTSTSTSTVIQNGKRVTRTTRTVRHADGRVETNTEESVEEGGNLGGGFFVGGGGGGGGRHGGGFGGSSFLGW